MNRIAIGIVVPLLTVGACNKQSNGAPLGALSVSPGPIALDVPVPEPQPEPCDYDGTIPVPDSETATCLAEAGGLPIEDSVDIWVNEYAEGWRIYAILETQCDPAPFASGYYLHVMRDDGRVLMDVIYEYQEDNPPDLDCWSQP